MLCSSMNKVVLRTALGFHQSVCKLTYCSLSSLETVDLLLNEREWRNFQSPRAASKGAPTPLNTEPPMNKHAYC